MDESTTGVPRNVRIGSFAKAGKTKLEQSLIGNKFVSIGMTSYATHNNVVGNLI